MTMKYFAWVMVMVFGECGASLAQPRIFSQYPMRLHSSPGNGLAAISPGNCPDSGPVQVIRVLIKRDSLTTSGESPCDKCIVSLTANVAGKGVLDPNSYIVATPQTAPTADKTIMDWPTPFDFDIAAGPHAIANQPTAVQIVLTDPQFDFYFPYDPKVANPTVNSSHNASQAAYVDILDAGHFFCPSILPINDPTNDVKGVTLQFFIDQGLRKNHPHNLPTTVPPSLNIGVIWKPAVDHPETFLPLAIDPHPTNNGAN
jgi:hypothetical protein